MYLLIDRIRRVVHQDSALLVIQLAVHTRVTDQVHDPFLAFVLVEAETGG